jgi:hypothetical protein
MAINFPNVYGVSESWQLTANTRAYVSELTGAEQVASLPGDKWIANISFNNLVRSDIGKLRAFLAAMRGRSGTCYLSPQETPLGTVSGTPLVNGASQTGTTLVTNGWGASETVLMAGDYFEVNGELKVATADVVSDGAGAATINFAPDLRQSPVDNEPIIVSNPKCTMRLTDDSQAQWQLSLSRVYVVGLSLVESIV